MAEGGAAALLMIGTWYRPALLVIGSDGLKNIRAARSDSDYLYPM
jgi:hypothetical protein